MKKFIIPAALMLVLAACGTTDNKNEVEHYPTYDTNQKQNINAPDSANNAPNPNGGID